MKAIGLSTWQGTWKSGTGTISTQTPTLKETPYSFSSRFEGTPGASPEELLAAAYAGCFNQALANNFGMIGLEARTIRTSVATEMGNDEEGRPAITRLHVSVEATVPDIQPLQFEQCAERSRTHCSIAKVLRCEITMSATLVP